MRWWTGLAAAAAATLSACGQSDDPGGLSADESRRLNEAAEMLDVSDVSADSLAAPDETALGNGEQPAETDENLGGGE